MFWITRDSCALKIDEMGNDHLANTIRFCRQRHRGATLNRVLNKRFREAVPFCQYLADDPPDGAAMAAKEELDRAMSRPVIQAERDEARADFWPEFRELLAEAAHQGIDA